MPAPTRMTIETSEAVAGLNTVRDWLRWATTNFSRARLTFGHGTQSPFDEAAFMILMSLDLPIDQLEPWLDARLLEPEREHLARLVERRIMTRTPAAYLVNAAFIQGRRFYVDPRVIIPRSYIGELLLSGAIGAVLADAPVTRVLDVCTGSGCLAILAAEVFDDAAVDALDISAPALDVARINVADYRLGSRVRLIQSDLFGSLEPGARYDLIIANPPYVATAEVAAFDPEYRAEPVLAHLGGVDGLELVRRILATAGSHLTPQGMLVVEIGTGRAALERAYPDVPFLWLDSAESEGEVFALPASALIAQSASQTGPALKPAKRATRKA